MEREKANGFLINLGSLLRGEIIRNRRFLREEDGLVTVEWVALAAAVVVGGITLVWLVMTNLKAPANSIGSGINNAANTNVTQAAP